MNHASKFSLGFPVGTPLGLAGLPRIPVTFAANWLQELSEAGRNPAHRVTRVASVREKEGEAELQTLLPLQAPPLAGNQGVRRALRCHDDAVNQSLEQQSGSFCCLNSEVGDGRSFSVGVQVQVCRFRCTGTGALVHRCTYRYRCTGTCVQVCSYKCAGRGVSVQVYRCTGV